MKPELKTFNYQISIEAVPYTWDTAEYYFGKGAKYNPDYPEDTFGRDTVFDMVKDALTYVLQAKCSWLARAKIQDVETLESPDKEYWEYLETKEEVYRKIEKTIKSLTGNDEEKVLNLIREGHTVTLVDPNGDTFNKRYCVQLSEKYEKELDERLKFLEDMHENDPS